jgi:hypothetical protein
MQDKIKITKGLINMNNIVIISQDKESVINYNNISCLYIKEPYTDSGKWQLVATDNGNHFFSLGSYSRGKCFQVLEEITDKIIRDVVRIEMPER